jgi:hypothetical protein
MYGLRRRASSLIVQSWVLVQLVSMTASPLAVCAHVTSEAVSIACSCAHSAAHECPMHHQAPAKSTSTSDCSCSGATHPDSAVLNALLGPVAVISESLSHPAAVSSSPLSLAALLQPRSWLIVPDSPPPRS